MVHNIEIIHLRVAQPFQCLNQIKRLSLQTSIIYLPSKRNFQSFLLQLLKCAVLPWELVFFCLLSQVLMRALRDFNMPKIVTDDVPVFLGLVGDLFPALDVPRQKKPHFEQMVKRSTLELRLQPEESFTLKVKDLLTVDGRPCDWYPNH